jgi:alanyl-tRNA synthetase
MTSAILEILALLTVSCMIGIFFTYRYWKAKHDELQRVSEMRQQEVNTLRGELQTAKSKANEQEKALALSESKLAKAEDSLKAVSYKKQDALKVNVEETKESEKEIALLKEELGEKERELQAVSKELELRKISYYRHIDGKRYKGITLHMADEAVAGKGDGRISMADAELIFDTISTGKAYTQVEKHTIKYLRENYRWTEEADALFRTKVRSWAALDHEL